MIDLSVLKTKRPEKVWKSTLQEYIQLFPDLNTESINGRRYYVTPEGNKYPSATTFLKYFDDGEDLKAWRERVGEEAADAESKRACDRGELIHLTLEKMLKNEEYSPDDCTPYKKQFLHIKNALLKNLDAVVAMEIALYSDKLMLAGRADLFGIWQGQLAIIDFKNKNWLSKKEDIGDYFLQTCLYALMFFERTKVLPEKMVIIASVEKMDVPNAQIFIEPTRQWIPELLRKVRLFHENSGYYLT